MAFLVFTIPFLGTALGALMVFFMKEISLKKWEELYLGLSAGVMTAAGIWSLLLPALDLGEVAGGISWLPATVGFGAGVLFLPVCDKWLPMGEKVFLKDKTAMLVTAVTLHNLPEGMAMAVIYAGSRMAESEIAMPAVFGLALGIAIQNIPEGAIIATPLRSKGMSKGKAFLGGVLSGVVEPIGAMLTLLVLRGFLLVRFLMIMPYLLAFAAGSMIYVVIQELVPDFAMKGKKGIVGFTLGFLLMMILDVALG